MTNGNFNFMPDFPLRPQHVLISLHFTEFPETAKHQSNFPPR
ncbi:hypothetical protein HOLDEFILI_02387 [Holdemania filiformis DSM 12042]|uniref:Uncharacterized protein n=1 Tax=Holdemania filiformis DSM 12042 TaxID=545696 RepID=B9Y982_9FIRM|nr:hypothetical protein HOLDEFILI_02387 [Holdemania filiformis DSM 12042]